jgi:hypothetical protein
LHSLLPVAPLYLPGSQSEQAIEDADASLYFPTAHGDRFPTVPVYPASARQSLNAVEPVSEPVPELDGQSVHATAVAASLYFPEAQAVTEFPLPVYPASARQSLSAFEAAGLFELAGQVAQSGGYSLALQGAHSVPTTPVPGPQHCPVVAQSPVTQVVDPRSELFPPSQSWHTAGLPYPTMPLVAVPAEQRVQAFVVVSQ